MAKSLLYKEIIPFVSFFTLLIVATIVIDFLLHRFEMVWVGRYLGIPGTLIILVSFLYSLRKRKIIRVGSPKKWMRFHELCAWFGSLLILVHGGIHFNALLPWLAIIAMLIDVISGLTGGLLLKRSRQRLSSNKKQFLQQGMSKNEVEDKIFWDAATLDLMKKWRSVHLPITLVFAVLSIIHIGTIFLFW